MEPKPYVAMHVERQFGREIYVLLIPSKPVNCWGSLLGG